MATSLIKEVDIGQRSRLWCRSQQNGIKYGLSLHEPYGKRIMGYDNAHAVKHPKKGKYSGWRVEYDHKHRHVRDKGVPYEFVDAYQLLKDFFAEVDRVLEAHRKG